MEPILKQAVDRIGGRCRTLTADEPFVFGLPLMIFFRKRPVRMKEELQALTNVVHYLSLLTGVNIGADVLLKAEWAFYRGCFSEAELLSYQVAYLSERNGQWPVRAGTVNLMAQIAFKRGSNDDLTKYIKALKESVGSDAMCPLVSQMLRADFYSWIGLTQLVPQWLREGKRCFPDAPTWVRAYLCYAHLVVLLQEEEYIRLLGAAEAAIIECRKMGYLMVEMYIHLIAAVGYLRTGRREEAFVHVRDALADALEDQLFLPFMEFKWMLGDLVEKAFSALGERMPKKIITNGQVISNNWKLLIRYISESNTQLYGLTKREMEVATLAAKGMSNKEIASMLVISESTVKYHLRAVFSKLDIDRRSKLSWFLNN